MNRFNDDGYTPVDDEEVTTSKSTELSTRQLALAKAQEDAMLADDEDYTTVAPIQHTETITKESYTITKADGEVSSQSRTEVPMDTIDHTDVDFSTEEVVDTPSEALRSPVVDVASIAKQVSTSSAAGVSSDSQVDLDEMIALHLSKLSSDEARAWTWKQEQLGKAAGLAAMKREGKTVHTLKQNVANLLIKGVASGKTNQEILTLVAARNMKADTAKVILDKKRPVQMEVALRTLSETDTKLQYLLKHTYMTVHTFGEWSDKSTIKAVMNKLRKAYGTADYMQKQDAINAELFARVQELENQMALKANKVFGVDEAKVRARELSADGKSSRAIATVITEAGYSVSFKTVARWVNH